VGAERGFRTDADTWTGVWIPCPPDRDLSRLSGAMGEDWEVGDHKTASFPCS